MASQRFPCLHTHETRRRVPTVHSHSLAPKQSDSFEGENPSGQSAKRLPKHTTTNTVCRRCFSEQENRPARVNLERAGEKRSGAVRECSCDGREERVRGCQGQSRSEALLSTNRSHWDGGGKGREFWDSLWFSGTTI